MRFVLTLIAASRHAAIDDALLRQLADMAGGGADGSAPRWLSAPDAAHQAVDIVFAQKPNLTPAQLARLFGARPIDYALQPLEGRAKKLLCIDMESTLIVQECLDEMATRFGIAKKIASLTKRAMRGEMDFAEALRARLACFRGFAQSELEEIAASLRFHPGAERLVRVMHANGARCYLVSGGFRFFVERVTARLPFFAASLCNDWQMAGGRLTGKLAGPLVDGEAKAAFLCRQLRALKIDKSLSLAVGDGANDIPMLRAAGFGAAYRGKPAVCRAADAAICHSDLTSLLYMQGYKDSG